MKKAIALILTAMLAISLVACTPAKTADENSGTTLTSTDTSGTTATGNGSPLTDPVPDTPEDNEPIESPETEIITRERAIEIALQQAGLTSDAVYDLEAELERERDAIYWEVDFDTRDYEYSYIINAITEVIIHEEQEFND